MRFYARIVCVVLTAALLSSCSIPFPFDIQSGSKWLRYDIPSEIDNLDPQFATGAARMVLANIGEGLLRGFTEYCEDVRLGKFPDDGEHTYKISEDEAKKLMELLG